MSDCSLENGRGEVENRATRERWVYSDTVKDHFFKPRNLMLGEPKEGEFDSEGTVGSPACGDVMRVWLKVDRATDRIADFRWKTFGCGSAIAASSMFSEMVSEDGGMVLAEAMKLRPQDVIARLGGLPNRKIHCSVLIDKAFRKAANAYFRASGQTERVEIEEGKVVDARLQITDRDIEEAVLEGATDLEGVQRKLKVGVGDPAAVPEIERLIAEYSKKYYG